MSSMLVVMLFWLFQYKVLHKCRNSCTLLSECLADPKHCFIDFVELQMTLTMCFCESYQYGRDVLYKKTK